MKLIKRTDYLEKLKYSKYKRYNWCRRVDKLKLLEEFKNIL